jgi:hypothetical protein
MMLKHQRDRPARLSDWRPWRVSVCIGVLASVRKEIICISDQKVTFPGFSSDYMTIKNEPGIGRCAVLYAGEDTQYAPLIFESARNALGENPHPREVADAIDDAYHGQISELIERRVLRRYKYDGESFRKNGKKLLSEAVFARICERIDKVNLNLRFLICGFDQTGDGHLFTAGGNQSVEGYDHIGLWAIGEGADSAFSTFSFHITHRSIAPPWSELNPTLTVALSAKFMAESASTVGEGTIAAILKKGEDVRYVPQEAVNTLRKEWLRHGAPRFAKRIEKFLPDFIVSGGIRDERDRKEAIRSANAMLGKRGYIEKVLGRKKKATPSAPEK